MVRGHGRERQIQQTPGQGPGRAQRLERGAGLQQGVEIAGGPACPVGGKRREHLPWPRVEGVLR